MNKIYKVIWSKTRNCYVAVAEFVKRSGKGGSVLNRRHIAAALAAVAICAAPAGVLANTGGHWDGDDYIGDAPEYNVTINEEVNGIAYGRYETGVAGSSGATLSIVTGGKANAAFGGLAASGVVTGNKVIMTGGEIVRGNSIVIGRINVSGGLFGGLADDGNVEKNTVEISGGTVNSWVIGGYAVKGEAKENSVTVSGGTVNGLVYGGWSFSGDATNNTVTIRGGTVNSAVHGGNSVRGAANNTVTISGGEVNKSVYGGYSNSGKAENNTVTVSGGTVNGWVYGGYSNSGKAENNTVTVSGGTVESEVYGGYSFGSNRDATNNTVTISGGTVNGLVYGGISGSGAATGNTVTISGGEVNKSVFGGFSFEGDATNNTVILSRQGSVAPPDINGTLFGGYSEFGGTVSNNTLQVEAVGLSAPQIQNFENYRFVLPSDVKKGDTMLTLKGQGADLTIDGTKVDLAVAKGGGLNIGFGESVTLLHKTGGTGAFNVENLTGAVQTSKLDGEAGGFDVMKYTLDKPANGQYADYQQRQSRRSLWRPRSQWRRGGKQRHYDRWGNREKECHLDK